MGGNTHTHGTRSLRRRRRGVASIVGALLVLLIALVSITLVLSEAVPSWMAQNESALGRGVEASFAQLQATVDLQEALGVPHTGLTSFDLTSNTVPVVGSPTQGSLLFEGRGAAGFLNVSVHTGAGGTGSYSSNVSLGALSAILPNRYIPSETLRFDSGAVFVLSGSPIPRMLYAPLFSLEVTPGNTSLSFTILSMTGPTAGTSAPGTQQVFDTLLSSSTIVSHGARGTGSGMSPIELSIRLGSSDACGWQAFFSSALASAPLSPLNYSLVGPATCSSSPSSFGILTLTLDSIDLATLSWVSLAMGIGSGT